MITDTRDKILGHIRTYNHARVHDLVRIFGISHVAVHKQLNILLKKKEIEKVGKPPLVFYVPTSAKEDVATSPSSSMKQYYYIEGIKKLAGEMSGNERICLAMRPYGFHAGNEIPFVIYPWLLAREFKKIKKEPKFKIFVVFNDWEQLKLDGPDLKRYPFNVHPHDTTIQYTPHPLLKNKNVVDYWEPLILKDVNSIRKEFPSITVTPVRYSSFKGNKDLNSILQKTINEPEIFFQIAKKYSNKAILQEPLVHAIAVCTKCKKTKGKTIFLNNSRIRHFCEYCFSISEGPLVDFDFWLYHTELALPRYQILDIDLCITGSDKLDESDYLVRDKLTEAYDINLKMPDVLYTPLVLDESGNRMGKSLKNDKYIEIKKLMKIVTNGNADKIIIT